MTLFILSECARKISSYSQSVYTKEIVKHCNLYNSTSGIVQCSSVIVIYNSRSVHVQVKFHQSLLSLNNSIWEGSSVIVIFVFYTWEGFWWICRLCSFQYLQIVIAEMKFTKISHFDFSGGWFFLWSYSTDVSDSGWWWWSDLMGEDENFEKKNKSSSSSFDEWLVFCNKLVMAAADLVATIHSTLRSCKVAKDKLL